MTIHEKVKELRPQLAVYRDEATTKPQKWALGLLHDALVFTGEERVQKMSPQTLAEFVELMCIAKMQSEPDFRHIRKSLLLLGFQVAPQGLN